MFKKKSFVSFKMAAISGANYFEKGYTPICFSLGLYRGMVNFYQHSNGITMIVTGLLRYCDPIIYLLKNWKMFESALNRPCSI